MLVLIIGIVAYESYRGHQRLLVKLSIQFVFIMTYRSTSTLGHFREVTWLVAKYNFHK